MVKDDAVQQDSILIKGALKESSRTPAGGAMPVLTEIQE